MAQPFTAERKAEIRRVAAEVGPEKTYVIARRCRTNPHTVKKVLAADPAADTATVEPPDPVKEQQAKAAAESRRQEHVNAVKELAFRDYLARLVRDNVRPAPPAAVPRPSRANARELISRSGRAGH